MTKTKEMTLSKAGLFDYSDLLDLLHHEWNNGYRVSKIWLTRQQIVHLQRDVAGYPKADTRPKLVAHMYPPDMMINIKTIGTDFGDVEVLEDE